MTSGRAWLWVVLFWLLLIGLSFLEMRQAYGQELDVCRPDEKVADNFTDEGDGYECAWAKANFAANSSSTIDCYGSKSPSNPHVIHAGTGKRWMAHYTCSNTSDGSQAVQKTWGSAYYNTYCAARDTELDVLVDGTSPNQCVAGCEYVGGGSQTCATSETEGTVCFWDSMAPTGNVCTPSEPEHNYCDDPANAGSALCQCEFLAHDSGAFQSCMCAQDPAYCPTGGGDDGGDGSDDPPPPPNTDDPPGPGGSDPGDGSDEPWTDPPGPGFPTSPGGGGGGGGGEDDPPPEPEPDPCDPAVETCDDPPPDPNEPGPGPCYGPGCDEGGDDPQPEPCDPYTEDCDGDGSVDDPCDVATEDCDGDGTIDDPPCDPAVETCGDPDPDPDPPCDPAVEECGPEEQPASAQGSGDCSVEPQCTPSTDPTGCAILWQIWREGCIARQWDGEGISDAVNSFKDGERIGEYSAGKLAELLEFQGGEIDITEDLSAATWLPSACPAAQSVTLLGSSFSLPYDFFCDLAARLKPLFIALCGLAAARILWRAL